jgi:hypothetical protein
MSIFNTTSITVTSRANGTYVKGRWTDDIATTSRVITGSWQVASPAEVKSLPELRHEQSVVKIYTASLLNSLLQNRNPDRVSIGGASFEVYSRAAYQSGLISHYRYFATEVLP